MPSPSGISSYDLVNLVSSKIEDKVAARGIESLTAEERIVYFIWRALGIIENGSFQYFFENEMDADATAESYQQLGLPTTAEFFRLAQSLLPSEYFQADWNRQLELLQEREASLDALAKRVLAGTKEAEDRLADYVLTHPNLAILAKE
jgi:DNA-binding MurR/RpiR family transcriptional regulator